MDLSEVRFVVEQAGCDSCAGRVRQALEAFATVRQVTVDESADVAFVSLASAAVSERSVNEALREASASSGHEYRVRPGSWAWLGPLPRGDERRRGGVSSP